MTCIKNRTIGSYLPSAIYPRNAIVLAVYLVIHYTGIILHTMNIFGHNWRNPIWRGEDGGFVEW
jgi:hypothetical protein